ncbi:MAG TPA: FMN-binding negative transcriptional regulator [Thermoanaerobaculia bacterium]
MYVRLSHQPRSTADVLRVIEEHMFATMVTWSSEGALASHLPFLIDPARGEHGTLLAHMARANPHSALLGKGEESLVMFLGPHAYISPSWYEDRATAPTWDYVAVHCYGNARCHSTDEARQNIARLIAVVEAPSPQPWSMSELGETEVRRLLEHVVSFEIPITRIEGKFKLNQGEKVARTQAAIAHLEQNGEAAMAAYLRRYNDL